MTKQELEKRLNDLLILYPKNPVFQNMLQELQPIALTPSNNLIQQTLQQQTSSKLIDRCQQHLKTVGIFQKIFCKTELREIKSLKRHLLNSDIKSQERLNHTFFANLKSKLIYSLENYKDNFHFKKIARDRREQVISMLANINDIGLHSELSPSQKIAELFNILIKANNQINLDDASPVNKHRNFITKSRLQTIILNYSQKISSKKNPTIRNAIARVELEDKHRSISKPLLKKLDFLKNKYQTNSHLSKLHSCIDNQNKPFNANSAKENFYSTIFYHLTNNLDEVIKEDQQLWFAKFRRNDLKQTLTDAILEVIRFAKKNPLIAQHITETLNNEIENLWMVHVQKLTPHRLYKSSSNSSFSQDTPSEKQDLSSEKSALNMTYDLNALYQAVPTILKPIILEYSEFKREMDEIKPINHPQMQM